MDRLLTMVKLSTSSRFSTQAYLIIGLQMGISLFLTTLGSLYYGHHTGFSIACGGLAVILPTIYFALRVFHQIQFKDSKAHLYNFYTGQIIKLFLSIILSLLMIILLHVALLPFMLGFLLTQLSIFLVPLLQVILRILSF
jgi:ATP synthase protein I